MEPWKMIIILYSALTIDFLLIGIITYYAINQRILDKSIYMLAAVFFASQFLILYFLSSGLEWTHISILIMLAFILFAIFCVFFLGSYFNLKKIFLGSNKTGVYALAAFTSIIGLAILYGYGKDFFITYMGEKRPTWLGFLLNVLFFIPCLLYDFVDWLSEEWTRTSMPIFFLVLLELVILVIYFTNTMISFNGNKTLLLPEPSFLKNQLVISGSQPMMIYNIISNINNPSAVDNNIRKDYAVTMWIYINDYISNNDSIDTLSSHHQVAKQIFCYGNSQKKNCGKPLISYYNRKLLVSFSDSVNTDIFQQTILLQKWNHIAINYKYNEADLFLNGELVHSHPFHSRDLSVTDLPSYDVTDIVTIGDEHGIDGAIANVFYYCEPMSQTAIAFEYNVGPPT